MNQNYSVYKLNGDQPEKIAGNTWKAHSNNQDLVAFYADVDTAKVIYVRFVYQKYFNLDNIEIPPLKYMGMAQDDLIDTIVPNGYVEDGYHLWIYSLPNSITGVNNSGSNLPVRVSFNIRELEQPTEYLGNITTNNTTDSTINAELKGLYPSATNGDYVNVYQNVSNDFNSWEYDGANFIKQTDPDVLNQLTNEETLYYQETIRPNSASQSEVTDRDITDDIVADVAENRTDIDGIIGVQGGLMQVAEYDTEATATKDVKYARNIGTTTASISYAEQKAKNDLLDQDVKTTASPEFVEVNATTVDYNDGNVSGKNTWNDTEDCIDTIINSNVTLQNGRELLKLGRNETGSTITNGTVVAIIGATGNLAKIEPVDINDYDQSFKVIGIATEDITNNSTGNVTLLGRVRGLNTSSWAEGTILYAGENGALTDVCPTPPKRCILMAVVETSNAGNGILWCWARPLASLEELSNVYISGTPSEGDMLRYNATNSRYEIINPEVYLMSRDIQNGAFKESFDFRYNATTSLMELTKNPNDPTYGTEPNNLTQQFSDGDTDLDVTSCTCAPTFGTATVPAHNYFYILQSNKGVIVNNTTGFPTAEHIKVAECVFLDETTTDNDGGALRNQNINNHEQNTNSIGALNDIRERIRAIGAKWESGVEGATAGDYVNGTLHWTSTAGTVWQMHLQTFDAKDTSGTDDIHVVNDFTTPYKTITTFDQITEYSDGTSIGNSFFNVFVWASINKSGEYDGIFANVPTGGYISLDNAKEDPDSKTVTTVPTAFRKTAFPIARLIFRKQGGTYTFEFQFDLRDTQFGIGGVGGGTGSDNEFTDNLFRINNVSDGTKQIAYDASGISTATTRTITMPDEDVDLGKVNTAVQQDLTEYPNNGTIAGTEKLFIDDTGTPKYNTVDEIATYIGNLSGSTLNNADYDDKGLGAFKTGFHTIYTPSNTVDADLVLDIFDTTDTTASAEIQNFFTTGGINKFMYIRVPDSLNDSSQGLTLTLDNGANTHNINVKGTQLIGTTALGKVLKIEYKYDATGSWVYQGTMPLDYDYTQQSIIGSTKEEVGLIDNGAPIVKEIDYVSVEQRVQNGDDFSANWLASNSTNSVANEILSNTGDGTSTAPRAYQDNLIDGIEYYVQAEMRVTNTLATRIGVAYGVNYFDFVDNPTQNEWYQISGKATVSGSTEMRLYHIYGNTADANGAVLEVRYVMAIPLDNTPYGSLTASELNAKFPNYIAYGLNDTTISLDSTGVQLFDGTIEIPSGDTELSVNYVSDTEFTLESDLSTYENGEDLLPNIGWDTNKQYTFSGTVQETVEAKNLRLKLFYTDGTDDSVFLPTTSETSFNFTSDVSKTIEKVVYTMSTTGAGITTVKNFMINEGTTAEEYRAYQNDTFTAPQGRSVGTVQDKLVWRNNQFEYDQYNEVETGIAIGATINDTLLPLIDTSGRFIAEDETTGETQTGAYGDTLTLSNASTVYYNLATPIIGTVVDTDGSVIQEKWTQFKQNTDWAHDITLTLSLNDSQNNVVQTQRINNLKRNIDSLEDRVGTNETNIATNTSNIATNTSNISTNTSNISTNTSDISSNATNISTNTGNIATNTGNISSHDSRLDSIETKTDFISISAAINLDKVAEFTLLNSNSLTVPTDTTEPASNITLSESIDNFDAIRVVYKSTGTGFATYYQDLILNANGQIAVLSKTYSITTTNEVKLLFRIERDSTTALTAYYGRDITTTYGSPANIVSAATTDNRVSAIYGIKY